MIARWMGGLADLPAVGLVCSKRPSHSHVGTELQALHLLKGCFGDTCQQCCQVQSQHCPLLIGRDIGHLDDIVSLLHGT